jgi:hypothetical protein
MNIQGTRMEPYVPKSRPRVPEEDLMKRRVEAIFLSKWEGRVGAEGDIVHPTIHHFCTHPREPQLPVHMQVLSRKTHAMPGILSVKSSRESSDIKVRW